MFGRGLRSRSSERGVGNAADGWLTKPKPMIRSPRFASLFSLAPFLTNFCGVTGRAGQDTPEPEDFSRCMAVTDDAAHLRCFESLVGKPAPSPPTMGGWRLVR